MNRLITSIAALTILTIPSHALTLEQAMNELGGMHCSGSTCTSESSGSRDQSVLISPAESGDPASTGGYGSHCPPMKTMNGGWQVRTNVDSNCTQRSLNPGNLGGRPAVYGVESVETCTTTSKELSYNGPATSRDKAWSIDTSTSTRDGSC